MQIAVPLESSCLREDFYVVMLFYYCSMHQYIQSPPILLKRRKWFLKVRHKLEYHMTRLLVLFIALGGIFSVNYNAVAFSCK